MEEEGSAMFFLKDSELCASGSDSGSENVAAASEEGHAVV